MKKNYQIYLPFQFHWRAHSVDREPQLSHKKMKTLFLSNMSKSRRLTSTFFPIIIFEKLGKSRTIESLRGLTFKCETHVVNHLCQFSPPRSKEKLISKEMSLISLSMYIRTSFISRDTVQWEQ